MEDEKDEYYHENQKSAKVGILYNKDPNKKDSLETVFPKYIENQFYRVVLPLVVVVVVLLEVVKVVFPVVVWLVVLPVVFVV